MANRVLRTGGMLLLGWILFSMTGTISMALSCPLPAAFHTFKSHMPYTGYTDDNILIKNMEEPYVEPGTFDELELFSNGNMVNGAYYDVEESRFYVSGHEEGSWLDETTEEQDTIIDEEALVVPIGYYECLLQKNEYSPHPAAGESPPLIRSKRGSIMYAKNLDRLFGKADEIQEQNIAEILELQTEEKISLEQFAGLLQMHYNTSNILLGWYPDEHKAVFYPDAKLCRVIETDTMEMRQYEIPEYQYVQAISADELLAYDPNAEAIVRYRFSTGETQVLCSGIEELRSLNHTWRENELILGGLYTEHQAFLYKGNEAKLEEFDLGNDFYADKFVFGKERFLIQDPLEDGGFRFKRGIY